MNQTQGSVITKLVLLTLLGIFASVGVLNAEDCSGSFTLPYEAHWGLATLPPGAYTFKINTESSPYTVRIYGKDGGALVYAAGVSTENADGRSELIIVRSGNKVIVRALRLAHVASSKATKPLVFTYTMPGGERQFMAQGPHLIQRLPVLLASK
jgi:hypothetical protein